MRENSYPSFVGLKTDVLNITQKYLQVAKDAEELVEKSYRCMGIGNVTFPIDINIIARFLKIQVTKQSLNYASFGQFNRVLALIIGHENSDRIIVDDSVSYKTQRYALANAIGRILLLGDTKTFRSSYAVPLIPQSLDETAADVIALFLLLPQNVFKEEFYNFLTSCKDLPVNTDDWLYFLSEKSQVSLFNLSIGYQQLKQVLCYDRQEKFSDKLDNLEELMNDKYDIIFA